MSFAGLRGARPAFVVTAALVVALASGCAPVQQTGTAVCTSAPDGSQAAIGVLYGVGAYPETVTAIELVDADGLVLVDSRIDDNETPIGASPWPTDVEGWVDGGPAVGATLPANAEQDILLVLERTAETGTASGVRISYDSLAGAGMRAEVAIGLMLDAEPCR